MLRFFNAYYFAFGLLIGLFYTYIQDPSPTIVYKYPTPDNVGQIIYQDKAGVCYKYGLEKVECPEDQSQMTKQPIQT